MRRRAGRPRFAVRSSLARAPLQVADLTLATYPRAQATKRGDRRAAVLLWRPVHLRVARALALRRRHRHGLHRHRVPAAVAGGPSSRSRASCRTLKGKCLVCSRYVTTYIYRCARADPTFKPSASIPLQAFGNALGVEAGENVPTHASVANDSDGYRQEALLFVDEQWADTAAARGGMASLLWRPCVKFDDARTTSTSRTTRGCRGCCSATWARRTSRRWRIFASRQGKRSVRPCRPTQQRRHQRHQRHRARPRHKRHKRHKRHRARPRRPHEAEPQRLRAGARAALRRL